MATSPPTGADAQLLEAEEPRVAMVSHTNMPKKTDFIQMFEHIVKVILQNKSTAIFFEMEDTHTKCPVVSEVRSVASSPERSLMLMYQSRVVYRRMKTGIVWSSNFSVSQRARLAWVSCTCIIYTLLQGRPKLTTQDHLCEHDKIVAAAQDSGKTLHSHRSCRNESEVPLHWKLLILNPYLFSKLITKVNCWVWHTLSTNADAILHNGKIGSESSLWHAKANSQSGVHPNAIRITGAVCNVIPSNANSVERLSPKRKLSRIPPENHEIALMTKETVAPTLSVL
jgi:hypothetical protein